MRVRVYMLRKVKHEVNSGETRSSRVEDLLLGGLQCQRTYKYSVGAAKRGVTAPRRTATPLNRHVLFVLEAKATHKRLSKS